MRIRWGATRLWCAVFAAVTVMFAAAPPASAASVVVAESWSGTLPAEVQPDQTVTILMKFGQSTNMGGVQVPGEYFDVWSESSAAVDHIQVQCLDPSTGSWVRLKADNADGWPCSFATPVTLSPGVLYNTGARFTIDSRAPAGSWTVSYPDIDGVITQTALPPGGLVIPQPPTRNFLFNSKAGASPSPPGTPPSTQPVRTPVPTRPAAMPTHARPASAPSPSKPAIPATTVPPASTTAPSSAAIPTSSTLTPPSIILKAVGGARSGGSGPTALFVATAGIAALFASVGTMLYRRRGRQASAEDGPTDESASS